MSYKTIIQEINDLIEKGQHWQIECINEFSGEKNTIELDMKKRLITSTSGWSRVDLANKLWRSGIIPASNENEVKEKIKQALPNSSQLLGIAPDTNILLSRYIPNLHYKELQYWQQKPIIVISRAINHEFHYMEGFCYKHEKYSYENLINVLDKEEEDKEELAKLITNSSSYDYFIKRLKTLSSYKGRLGLKGSFELGNINKSELQVILSKPDHMYYSEKIQTQEGSLIDAMYDSLIRYELDFFIKNTNVDVLFLTADKQQANSCTLEGIDNLYIVQPVSWQEEFNCRNYPLKNQEIVQLLKELLTTFLYLKLSIDDQNGYLFTSIWSGKTAEDHIQGNIRILDVKKGIASLLI